MRTTLVILTLLVSLATTAQETKKHSTGKDSVQINSTQEGITPYWKTLDTAGMGQYGMRIYDPRMGRYMPVDTNHADNPYGFAQRKEVVNKKRSVKKGKL
jgi:hypothetical protein